MKLAMIGLGKMGYNLTLNLIDNKHEVVAFDVDNENVVKSEQAGAIGAYSIEEALSKLESPKVVWMMVPAGEITENVLSEISSFVTEGDIIIDGGNSNYKDTLKRAEELAAKGVHYLDVGTSGGMEGARNGACTMVGGNEEAFKHVEKLFQDICVENGYLYAGKSGSGHFLKMVHNGVEYGMMQAIAEGFDILEKSDFDFDYEKVARVYRKSVV